MDDPDFMPDLALPALDFDTFKQALEDSQYSMASSVVSPGHFMTSISSQASVLELQIPTSDNDTPGKYQFPGHFQLGSSAQKTPSGINPFDDEGQGLLDDLDFEFDADGGMVDVNADELERRRTDVNFPGVRHLESDSAASGRVRREHEDALAALSASERLDNDGDFIMQMDDDMRLLPDAEAFPTGPRINLRVQEESSMESSSISAEVPMKKRKYKPKAQRVISDMKDEVEIRNSEFKDWQKNYVNSMSIARQGNHQNRTKNHAKNNGNIFVWGNGIGGIGKIICSAGNVLHPLDIFCGEKLKELVTGVEIPASPSSKRTHSAFGGEDDEAARNVRARHDWEPHLARAAEDGGFLTNFDDDMMPPPDDTTAAELGREAFSPMADHHSSAMPWNISTSLNSFRLGSSSLPRGPSRQSSILLGRPGSRLTSASPLLGRGRIFDEDEANRTHLSPSRDEDSTSVIGADEFEAFGPSAAVDTQTAQNSQWIAEALETESFNFLEFVRASAAEASEAMEDQETKDADDGEEEDTKKWVGFEALFPPRENYRIVAAQAFYHVLSLATKNLLSVRQEEGGEVRMFVRD
jgi:hypothetical protein